MRTLIFRVDATQQVALGHLKRCLALSGAISELDFRVVFICFDEPAARELLLRNEVIWSSNKVADESDADNVVRIAKSLDSEVIIVDSYHISNIYLNTLKSSRAKIISGWPSCI